MANAIGRQRVIGIAKETVYGTPAGAPTFYLPILDLPTLTVVQNKAENISALGSAYQVNAVKNTTRMATFTLNFKLNEDVLPLILGNKFSISSAAASGETVVYTHTLAYNSGITGASITSYTLFLDDPILGDVLVSGAKFNSVNMTAEIGDFIKCEVSGTGKVPSSTSFSPSLTQPTEFVGRNVGFEYADYGSSYASTPIMSLNFNHTFNLSDEGSNFVLGSADLNSIYTTEDRFELSGSRLLTDSTIRDDFTNNTKVKAKISIIDTDRYVTGSVASTRPSIIAEYPAGYITTWAENGDLTSLIKEDFTFLPVDEVGIADAPAKFTITNKTASY